MGFEPVHTRVALKEPKPKLFGPDIFGRGGGLPREGVEAKEFASKPGKSNFFWRDIPEFCRDIPEVPEKFEKKKFVFSFWPLLEFLAFFLLQGIPFFYERFSLLPQGFEGFAKDRKSLLLWWFSLPFSKKAGKGRSGLSAINRYSLSIPLQRMPGLISKNGSSAKHQN